MLRFTSSAFAILVLLSVVPLASTQAMSLQTFQNIARQDSSTSPRSLIAERKAQRQKTHLTVASQTKNLPTVAVGLKPNNTALRLIAELKLQPAAPDTPVASSSSSNSSSSVSSSSSSEPDVDPLPNTEEFRQAVFTLINDERTKEHLSPLVTNALLEQAAQAQATDMVTRHFFDHQNPDGKTSEDRIRATGYLKVNCTTCSWSYSIGENIAKGQSTPEQVVQDWMNSPGHRANILNPDFTETGIGFDTYYWVQEFGTMKRAVKE